MKPDIRAIIELLEKVKEQGLSHQCAMEGFIDKYGCSDCEAGVEKEIDKMIEDLKTAEVGN